MSDQTCFSDLCRIAVEAIEIEAEAVAGLTSRIGADFHRACEILLACRGRIVVTGMGKSGIIAKKLASTLASTGSPAMFLHPAEGSHGDLGMLTREDALLALSNSGETGELLAILPWIKRMGVPLLAMTGRADSTLARMADVHVDVAVAREACPHNLAPTASTTAALAMGDALAMALLHARGFSAEDFALSHPGGALGKRLLLRVDDVMRKAPDLPRVPPGAPLRQAIVEISSKGLGMTAVADTDGRLQGVFTDGDLRRALDRGITDLELPIRELMQANCRTIGSQALAAEALALMEQHRINGLLVVDDGLLVGAFNMHDLLRAGVV